MRPVKKSSKASLHHARLLRKENLLRGTARTADFNGASIAILGFGREGQSVLRFIRNQPEYQRAEIWILDKNSLLKIPRNVRAQLGKHYLKNLLHLDLIIRSPGVQWNLPELSRARAKGVQFSSSTKLFFEHCPAHIIGVTGTKGKGTTSTLTYEILKAADKKVFLAGNIGTPALDTLPKLDVNSWVVLELSSFQLIDLEMSPHVAVVLMVTSEHLDWHADIEEYVDAKKNIVRFQSPDDYAVIGEDYPRSRSFAKFTVAKVLTTYSKKRRVRRGAWVEDGTFWFSSGKEKERICAVSDLWIPGLHNLDNASAAIAVAKILEIPNARIKQAIQAFRGLPHRLELVRTVRGVKYYDDSYSTTPETAEVAIDAFAAPKILILGGSSKGSDFSRLGRVISRRTDVKAIIGIGVEWPRIKRYIKNPRIQMIEGCRNMHAIVRAAHAIASPGEVVLLSPACASFDMFKNYTHRGEEFKKRVQKLK